MDTASLRQLLNQTFDDEALTAFCFDNFRPVHDRFSSGMSKSRKIQLLLDHCERFAQTAHLEALVDAYRQQMQGQASPPAGPASPPRPEPPPSTGRPERGTIPFTLQIEPAAGEAFAVRVLRSPMGESHGRSRLPYDPQGLIAVLKLLEAGEFDPAQFKPEQTGVLNNLGLLAARGGRAAPDQLARLGQGLYQALFPGDVGDAFRMALNDARRQRQPVTLQLRFDQEAVDLARYPWELLHDGHRHLLPSGAVELTRYITYAEAVTTLPAPPPWRLLYVAARPQDSSERLAVWQALQSLAAADRLQLDLLTPPTYDDLLAQTSATSYHILHFDGHGIFARRCPQCDTMSYPHLATCPNCGASLGGVRPTGYLAFEDPAGQTDYVSTADLENVLFGQRVRLAVLSACQSGTVRGGSLFGGLGPGLIRAGVPAVVAMQFSVPVPDAIRFATGFYSALARAETIPGAVAQGRRQLFRSRTWFMPALYLRSEDDEHRLFTA